jgi:hypothetical protein
MEEETYLTHHSRHYSLATYPTFSLYAYVYFGSNLCTAPAVMGRCRPNMLRLTAAENSTCSAKGAFNFNANQSVVLHYLAKAKVGHAKNI